MYMYAGYDVCDHISVPKTSLNRRCSNSSPVHPYNMLCVLQNPSAPSPIGQMPNQDGMPGAPGMPPGFFPVSITDLVTSSHSSVSFYKRRSRNISMQTNRK